MVQFQPGTPYDSELIAELNNDLQSSGYFEGVRVDAAPTAAGEDIPVEVRLDTRNHAPWAWAWAFDRRRPARQGQLDPPLGQPARPQLRLGDRTVGARQNVGLWYDIPLDPPLTDKLALCRRLPERGHRRYRHPEQAADAVGRNGTASCPAAGSE
jgi:translocation and assembly module TamA